MKIRTQFSEQILQERSRRFFITFAIGLVFGPILLLSSIMSIIMRGGIKNFAFVIELIGSIGVITICLLGLLSQHAVAKGSKNIEAYSEIELLPDRFKYVEFKDHEMIVNVSLSYSELVCFQESVHYVFLLSREKDANIMTIGKNSDLVTILENNNVRRKKI